jgi:hypothetical protein
LATITPYGFAGLWVGGCDDDVAAEHERHLWQAGQAVDLLAAA